MNGDGLKALLRVSAALALCGSGIAPALAQQEKGPASPTPAADAPQAGIQDIIVTARKRQESLLRVPVVETALGQQTLERLQTAD